MNSFECFQNGIYLGTVSLRKNRCSRRVFASFCFGAIIVTLIRFGLLFKTSGNSHLEQKTSSLVNPKFRSSLYNDLRGTFKERQALLEVKCQSGLLNHDQMSRTIQESRFYYMKQPDFLMCMIPKVASTTFSRFILNSHQKIGGNAIRNLGYSKSFENSVTDSTKKMMVVRHPLERLLSAYLYVFHKEVKNSRDRTSLYSNLTKILVRNYREKGVSDTEKIDEDTLLTFPEFVRYVINGSREDLRGELIRIPGKSEDFWKHDENINSHWLPYWSICTPCNPKTRPDFILVLDSDEISREVDFAFKTSGIYDFFRSKGLKANDLKFPWINSSGLSEEEKRKYFSQLTKTMVKNLYEKFKIDHELFGYDIQPYLSMASS